MYVSKISSEIVDNIFFVGLVTIRVVDCCAHENTSFFIDI